MKTLGKFLGVCLVGLSAAAWGNETAQVTAAAQVAAALAQDKVCTRCHDESEDKPVLSIYRSRHGVRADGRTPTCQSCHGPSDAHVRNPQGVSPRPGPDTVFAGRAKSSSEQRNQACLGCHESSARMNWGGSEHESRDVSCVSCHSAHAPADKVLSKTTQSEVCFNCHKSQRAQIHRISSHPLKEGKMACSSCHNPHGSAGPKLLTRQSVNETCYTCHAEKRGPFLWNHDPVTDDCSTCHTPHGSNTIPLLKARAPWLCQECHSADHARNVRSGAGLPGGSETSLRGSVAAASQSPAAQLNARACLSCHSQVHGSNHPAGAKFNR